ncbi:MAG: LamG domain-containing protein [Candidatus Poribacteria bacterium]|nr:LamG domain-containing protein [Candidatus Poribacteria bacterium]
MYRAFGALAVSALFVASSILPNSATAQDGLIGHWTFDEGAGAVVGDSAGANNGDVMGNPQWSAEGSSGGSMAFDGDGDYIQTTLLAPIQTADNLTVTAWFKTNVTASGQQHLLWIGDVAGNGWGAQSELHLGINHFGFLNKLVLFYGTGADVDGQVINIVSLRDFTDTSGWHHIGAVIENASGPTVNATLYLDGVALEPLIEGFATVDGIPFPTTNSTSNPPDRSGWNTALRIGSPGAASRYFNGMVDDVRVYNRALPATEIMGVPSAVAPQGKLAMTWAAAKTQQ